MINIVLLQCLNHRMCRSIDQESPTFFDGGQIRDTLWPHKPKFFRGKVR